MIQKYDDKYFTKFILVIKLRVSFTKSKYLEYTNINDKFHTICYMIFKLFQDCGMEGLSSF